MEWRRSALLSSADFKALPKKHSTEKSFTEKSFLDGDQTLAEVFLVPGQKIVSVNLTTGIVLLMSPEGSSALIAQL